MLSRGEARLIRALRTRSGREKHGAFLVEGVRLIEDLLASGIDLNFAVVAPSLEDSPRGRLLAEALMLRTDVRRVREPDLQSLGETESGQGVLAIARVPQHQLTSLQPQPRATALVLDAVQDPGNLGTLIRTADAFAADCVIALPGTVDFWNSKVVRSTAGAAFRVPLITESAETAWSWLAAHRFTICGADMQGTAIDNVRHVERIALVVGNEGSGLREETRARLATTIAIPMPGRAESLNVAVAAGILLYELKVERTDERFA